MKKLIQIWVGLAFCCQVFAQDVNLSTGTGSFSLPLTALQEGSIGVPVIASYDGSGVQVDAVASNVGLNWGLIAGGKISRTIRRYADEGAMKIYTSARGGYYYNDVPLDPSDKFQTLSDTERDIFTLSLNGQNIPFVIRLTAGQTTPQAILLKQNTDISIEINSVPVASPIGADLCNFTYTLEQLLTHWSVNNLTSFPNLANKPKFYSFKVTTTDGLEYYFGETTLEREYGFIYQTLEKGNFLYPLNFSTSSSRVFPDFATTPIAWNLSRIVKPKGKANPTDPTQAYQEVKFTYKRTKQIFQANGYDESFTQHYPPNLSSLPCVLPIISAFDIFRSTITLNSQLIKIDSDNLSINFNDNTIPLPPTAQIKTVIPDYNETSSGNFSDRLRRDLFQFDNVISPNITITCTTIGQTASKPNPIYGVPLPEVLKNIVIVDKTTSKKQGYYFHHGYFNYYDFINQSRKDYTEGNLKLLGIYPIKFLNNIAGGANEIEVQKGHQFKYNNTTLPKRGSLAKDAWGYPNGQDNNVTSGKGLWMPNERYLGGGIGTTCSQSNTSPNLDYAQSAILHTIVSPTGGWSEIDYELHDCDNYFDERTFTNGQYTKVGLKKVGGLRVSKIRTYDPVTNQTFTKKYTYTKKNSTESSGFLSIFPNVVYGLYNNATSPPSISGEYFAPSVSPDLMSRFVNGNYITYRFVKEEQLDEASNNNGYIEHEFINKEKQPYLITKTVLTPVLSTTLVEDDGTIVGKCYDRYYQLNLGETPKFDFEKGLEQFTRVYSKDGKLLSENENVFEVNDLTNSITGLDGKYLLPPSITKIENRVPIPLPWVKGASYTSTAFSAAFSYSGQLMLSNAAGVVSQGGYVALLEGVSALQVAASISGFTQMAMQIITVINDIGLSVADNSTYYWKDYKIPVGKINIKKTISRSYNMDTNDYAETTTEFTYGSTNHFQLTETKSYQTESGAIKAGANTYSSKVKYNKDYAIPASPSNDELKGIAGLNNLKMLVPIESVSLKNNKTMGGSYTEFYPTGLAYTSMPKKSYALEITRPLSAFVMSDVSGGVMTKNTNYVSKVDYLEYNTRGLLSKVKGTNQITESSTQFGYNGYLPTSSTFGTAALSMTTSTEFIPLFGATKTTAPDNTFVTTTYDELGRVTKIKDFKGDTRKSFDYKTVLPKQPTLDFGFKLIRSADNADLIDITDGLVINKASLGLPPAIPNVNIRLVPPAGTESVVFELQGSINKNSTDSQGTLWRVYEDTNGNGFNILDVTSNGTYTLTAKIYSKKNERGDLIGTKKITFTIQ